MVRLHAPVAAGKSEFNLQQLYSTTLFGMGGSAVVAGIFVIGFAILAPQSLIKHPGVRLPLALVSILVVIQVIDSGLSNLLRASERSALLMKYQVAKKYLAIGLIIAALLLVSRSLTAFYVASIVAEGTALAVLLSHALRGRDLVRPGYFSKPLYLDVVGYGIPMMIGYELSGVILSMGDRLVIKVMIGDAQLGLYAAAYNMSQYIGSAIIYSFSSAMMPVYMRMASQEGRERPRVHVKVAGPLSAAGDSRDRRRDLGRTVPPDHPRVGQVRGRRRRAAVGDRRHGPRRPRQLRRRRPLH